MYKQIKISVVFTAISTVSLGIIYPALLSGIALIMPSLPHTTLLTQPVEQANLFQGRPSMSGGPYSGASNLSLTSQALAKEVDERLMKITKYAHGILIPRDLLFASASGYDPDISIEAAGIQIPRIAMAHNMDSNDLRHLVDQHTHHKLWGFIGTDRVNVVSLNEALMKLNSQIKPSTAP
jgi:K+-transporting ATPase ATPase C chain